VGVPILPSLLLALVAFGLDRAQKHFHVAAECFSIGQSLCVGAFSAYVPPGLTGWRGGEVVRLSDFFDYVLVWNTGISYGLLDTLPAWVLGLLMAIAMAALVVWWLRADSGLIRAGLALALGGAFSNAIDRLIWGAVADFFHFHWGTWSFYVFNIADAAITVGVLLLFLDIFGLGRGKRT
jgi:signal peptidase II